jgi:hypothetical protein
MNAESRESKQAERGGQARETRRTSKRKMEDYKRNGSKKRSRGRSTTYQ